MTNDQTSRPSILLMALIAVVSWSILLGLVKLAPAQEGPGTFDTDLQTHRLHVGVYPVSDPALVHGYGWHVLFKDKAECMAAPKTDKEVMMAILQVIAHHTGQWGPTAMFYVCEAEIAGQPT